jgi:hypothetical protein
MKHGWGKGTWTLEHGMWKAYSGKGTLNVQHNGLTKLHYDVVALKETRLEGGIQKIW